jgi:uncharacterized protein
MNRLCFGSMLLFLLLAPVTAMGRTFSPAPFPHLEVRGEAELRVPANQLQLAIGVVTQARTAQAALDLNRARMKKVEQAFQRLGLKQDEYRTGHFAIQPEWSFQPQPLHPPEIQGFTVTNSFTVTTARVDMAGQLIEAAVQAGANSIGELIFGLSDLGPHRTEAIRQATEHARREAETLAAAAAVTLGEILFLSTDPLPAIQPQRLHAALFEEAGAALSLIPGEISIRAGVAILFKIVH